MASPYDDEEEVLDTEDGAGFAVAPPAQAQVVLSPDQMLGRGVPQQPVQASGQQVPPPQAPAVANAAIPDSEDEMLRDWAMKLRDSEESANKNRGWAQLAQAGSNFGASLAKADRPDQKPFQDLAAGADQSFKNAKDTDAVLRNYVMKKNMMAQRNAQFAQGEANKDSRATQAQAAAMERARVAAAALAGRTPEDKKLGLEEKKTIESLAVKNANKQSIAGQIDALTSMWDTLKEPEKLQQGRQILKVLNSSEGQDAVGAEEARRLGGKLEIAFGGLTTGNPGQFGRDLEGFAADAKNTSNSLKAAALSNQKIIESASGRKSGVALSKPQMKNQAPAVGSTKDGYRFKGGDPGKKNNWEKI